ncbi:MAG: SPOR domain-containing protein [Prevotella sp.]|jgi:hypothetical protein|nr:SPOR domain-containing protein [Prevotella sp.]
MKRNLFFLLFLFSVSGSLFAQKGTATIVTDLNTAKAGEGNVKVYEDEAILGLIGSKQAERDEQPALNTPTGHAPDATTPVHANNAGATTYKEVAGYKIQVFSGNDQRNSKNEASARKDMVKGLYPDMEVNVYFNSPVWRVRAGNFASYEQAFQAMKDMKKAFPTFGKELQIVRAMVRLPMN